MTIGTNLKKCRTARGLTQEDLAQRLHVTRQTVSSWERNNSHPDLDQLAAIAAALDTEVTVLLYGPENPARPTRRQVFRAVVPAALAVVLGVAGDLADAVEQGSPLCAFPVGLLLLRQLLSAAAVSAPRPDPARPGGSAVAAVPHLGAAPGLPRGGGGAPGGAGGPAALHPAGGAGLWNCAGVAQSTGGMAASGDLQGVAVLHHGSPERRVLEGLSLRATGEIGPSLGEGGQCPRSRSSTFGFGVEGAVVGV